MKDTWYLKLIAAALVIWGLKLILFGGTKNVRGQTFELFGFEFGSSEKEPMGTFECWFVGLALIGVGAFMFKHLVWG